MSDKVQVIRNAITRLRKLERYNKLELTAESIRDLDAWIRQWLYSDELTESERQRLQDFYIATLR